MCRLVALPDAGVGQDNFLAGPSGWGALALLHGHQVTHLGRGSAATYRQQRFVSFFQEFYNVLLLECRSLLFSGLFYPGYCFALNIKIISSANSSIK